MFAHAIGAFSHNMANINPLASCSNTTQITYETSIYFCDSVKSFLWLQIIFMVTTLLHLLYAKMLHIYGIHICWIIRITQNLMIDNCQQKYCEHTVSHTRMHPHLIVRNVTLCWYQKVTYITIQTTKCIKHQVTENVLRYWLYENFMRYAYI